MSLIVPSTDPSFCTVALSSLLCLIHNSPSLPFIILLHSSVYLMPHTDSWCHITYLKPAKLWRERIKAASAKDVERHCPRLLFSTIAFSSIYIPNDNSTIHDRRPASSKTLRTCLPTTRSFKPCTNSRSPAVAIHSSATCIVINQSGHSLQTRNKASSVDAAT